MPCACRSRPGAEKDDPDTAPHPYLLRLIIGSRRFTGRGQFIPSRRQKGRQPLALAWRRLKAHDPLGITTKREKAGQPPSAVQFVIPRSLLIDAQVSSLCRRRLKPAATFSQCTLLTQRAKSLPDTIGVRRDFSLKSLIADGNYLALRVIGAQAGFEGRGEGPPITRPCPQIAVSISCYRRYPRIFSTSSASESMMKGMPEMAAASGVRATRSSRLMCGSANFRAPAMNCCNPWVMRER